MGAEVSYTKLVHALLARGILQPAADGQLNEFSVDYAFSSPSAAAAVVAGRPANGRIHWVVEGTKQTYGEWQAEQVSRVTGALQAVEEGADSASTSGTVGP